MRPASLLLTFLSLLFVNSTVGQEVTIHAQSNVVLIPVLVKDAQGHAIYGLQAQDFIVEDDGAAQAVRLDEAAEAQPMSLVIAVQRGRQAYREFSRIRGLSSMIQSVLDQEGTLAAVVEFDSGIELSQEFTGEPRRVENTLKTLEPGDGGAAILDAVKYSLNSVGPASRGAAARAFVGRRDSRPWKSRCQNRRCRNRDWGDQYDGLYASLFTGPVERSRYRPRQQQRRNECGARSACTIDTDQTGNEKERAQGDLIDDRRRVRFIRLPKRV